MSILNRLFPKRKSKENIEAHQVVEQKTSEAQDVLKSIQAKVEQTANEIDAERKRSNKEIAIKAKQLRDVAQEIAIIAAGGKA